MQLRNKAEGHGTAKKARGKVSFLVNDYITAAGPKWRVKLSVSDYSESPMESQRQIPTSFWIQIVPSHWPKSASFSSYGAVQKKFNFHGMIAHAEALSKQKIKIPKRWEKYTRRVGGSQ